MPGRRGAALAVGIIAVAVAAPSSAVAAQERILGQKSRTVSPAEANPLASASKKKKKKKRKKGGPPATTQSTQVSFGSGTTVIGGAACTGKSHITGGGFSVSPSFTPPFTGLRSVTSTTQPAGPQSWTASSSAFTNPVAAGTFTTFARCESDTFGKLAGIFSSSVILSPGNSQTFTFNCPPGTHAISGGYAGQGLAGFNYTQANLRIFPLQSRRTSPGQWVVQVLNGSNSPAPAQATGFALCEQDSFGRVISEASTLASLVDESRATGDPTCGGNTHVISGGFVISPNSIGTVPATAIDEFQPVGEKTWHVGLHELVGFTLPAGSSLQSYAYCAPDSLSAKKKRKRKKK